MNISYPNLVIGGMGPFVQSPARTFQLTYGVPSVTHFPVIVKLPPIVTDIHDIAISARKGGADAILFIKTIPGMIFDQKTGKPLLGGETVGQSGSVIIPPAIPNAYLFLKAMPIPVIGVGGIEKSEDAIQSLLAGAKAVVIGTALFYKPRVISEIIQSLEDIVEDNHE